MTHLLPALVDQAFAAFEAKDVEGVLRCLTDDAQLIDPHYPAPHMIGKVAIAGGLRWVFGMMDRLSLEVVSFCASEDGRQAAVETATAHVLRWGMAVNLHQVFMIDVRDGRIARLQAYTPYGPGGIGGLILMLLRVRRSLWGRRTHHAG